MATLTIRDFPDDERDRLRKQAAENGRSMEAEARRLILEGLAKPKLSVDETVARLKAIMAKIPKRKSKRPLSEEFLKERRAMWGEE
jgi:plasmid stability protein